MVSKLKSQMNNAREKWRGRRRWKDRKRWHVTLRTRTQKIQFLMALTLPFLIVTLLSPPIPQDQRYHNFADTREVWRIPNFMDVSSNLAMLLVGLYGAWVLGEIKRNKEQTSFAERKEILPYQLFFWGLALTAVGSVHYHLNPNDLTLVWDRLPMTVGFMALFAVIIMERVSFQWGQRLLGPMILVGVLSVVYWYVGVKLGLGGDLRFYANVQYYPMLVIPLIIRYFPSDYSHGWVFGRVVLWYLVAKVVEIWDRWFFGLTGGMVSGHTMKHLFVAVAAYQVLWMLERRRVKGVDL